MKKLIIALSLAGSLFANVTFDSNDLCYKTRNYPMSYDVAFNSMKETLVNSNMHLKEVNQKDRFISAEGTKSYDGVLYTFTFTIVFKENGDLTNIKTIVSYDTVKSESEVKGVSTLNIPVPIPWSQVFKYKGTTNVDDPQFFDSFYTSFDLNAFNYQMKQMNINIENKKNNIDMNISKKLDIIHKETNTTKEINKTTISKDTNNTKKVEKIIEKEDKK